MTGQQKKYTPAVEIALYEGEEAQRLLADASFVSEWQALARKMKMVTVIQEPPFVLTWYRQYADMFRPVLAVGRNTRQELVGLLPLAFDPEKGALAHAGAWQGEYHGWICAAEVETEFLTEAVVALKKRFRLRKWAWRWMPPGANVAWLRSKRLKKEGIFARTVEQEPPLLELENEAKIRKIRRNKSLRTKMNRYSRNGNLRLEHVTSPQRAARIFDELVLQTNFRQMAVHGERPFDGDPHKKDFYLARLRFPANNHFTVLWFNERPLAYHFGACDETTVYLGLTGYDPRESKNSPGILLLVRLIELLREEGFRFFDLTPGEDEYKARLGSTRHKVVQPTFYFTRQEKLVADLKNAVRVGVKIGLRLLGADPGRVKKKAAAWADFFGRLRESEIREYLTKIAGLFYSVERYRYFEVSEAALNFDFGQKAEMVHFQRYSNLLLFRSESPWLTQQDVLTETIEHFSRGEELYTLVKNQKLFAFGWRTDFSQLPKVWKKALSDFGNTNRKTVIFHDFWPNSDGHFSEFKQLFAKMVADAFAAGPEKVGFLLPQNSACEKSATALGCVPAVEVKMIRRLGKEIFKKRGLNTAQRPEHISGTPGSLAMPGKIFSRRKDKVKIK